MEITIARAAPWCRCRRRPLPGFLLLRAASADAVERCLRAGHGPACGSGSSRTAPEGPVSAR